MDKFAWSNLRIGLFCGLRRVGNVVRMSDDKE